MLQYLLKAGIVDLQILEKLVECMEDSLDSYERVFPKASGFTGLMQALHQFEKKGSKTVIKGGNRLASENWRLEGKQIMNRFTNSPLFFEGLKYAETGKYTMEAVIQIVQGMLTLEVNRKEVTSIHKVLRYLPQRIV